MKKNDLSDANKKRNPEIFSAKGCECSILKAEFNIEDERRFLKNIRVVAEKNSVHIICFNADNIAGTEHIRSALAHAWRSFSEGKPIANSFEMETLLYTGGTRQCQEASVFGVHQGENHSFICICPPCEDAVKDMNGIVDLLPYNTDLWEDINPEKMKRLMNLFSITEDEIGVVGKERFRELILERVALLDVYK
ncbi:MAG: KEOPS complex subunit Cgi121 [Euryarchaeota archaeon]|nr:KEOPS complex subunit Cgi121 [Euryarchaeota archaeon]